MPLKTIIEDLAKTAVMTDADDLRGLVKLYEELEGVRDRDREKVVILLDIDKVLTESEIESIRSASGSCDTDEFNAKSAQVAA